MDSRVPFGIAGIIIGGLQQLIVVTGVHMYLTSWKFGVLAKDGY